MRCVLHWEVRAAEEIFLGKVSTGASNDLERVTKQAYAMVVYFGMSEKLPNLNYYDSSGQDWGFTKPYSEDTAKMIDEEVQRIVNEQYDRAKTILSENREGHNPIGSGVTGTGSDLYRRCRDNIW